MLNQQTFSAERANMLKTGIAINVIMQEHPNTNTKSRIQWENCFIHTWDFTSDMIKGNLFFLHKNFIAQYNFKEILTSFP